MSMHSLSKAKLLDLYKYIDHDKKNTYISALEHFIFL